MVIDEFYKWFEESYLQLIMHKTTDIMILEDKPTHEVAPIRGQMVSWYDCWLRTELWSEFWSYVQKKRHQRLFRFGKHWQSYDEHILSHFH